MPIPNTDGVPHLSLRSAVWQLATRCLILGVGFRGQAIQWKHSRDRGSKGRCHGIQFWDCISCKWTLTEDKDKRLSCKGWFVFSHLWRSELLQAGDCQVGNWRVNISINIIIIMTMIIIHIIIIIINFYCYQYSLLSEPPHRLLQLD